MFLLLAAFLTEAREPVREFYELRVYRYTSAAQESQLDQFLQQALIPAFHRRGISLIGVFKAIPEDTANRQRTFVLIPYRSLAEFDKVNGMLLDDAEYRAKGRAYLEAPYNEPPYLRMESTILKAFKRMPAMEAPPWHGDRSRLVYELRSYEGPTDLLYKAKVKMFNEGNEVGLFRRLNFHAVFYADVISGSRMPNLMYMTTFESKAERDSHWTTFVNDAEWKRLSAMAEYQHTVSKSDIMLLRPTVYSDY